MQFRIPLVFTGLTLASGVSALCVTGSSNATTPQRTSSPDLSNSFVSPSFPNPTAPGPNRTGVKPHYHFTPPGPSQLRNNTSPVTPCVAPTGHVHLSTGVPSRPHSFTDHTSTVNSHVYVPSGHIAPAVNGSTTVTRPCPTCPPVTILGSGSATTVYKPCPTCPPVTIPGSDSATTVYKPCPTCPPVTIPGSSSTETKYQPCPTGPPIRILGSKSTIIESNTPTTSTPPISTETTTITTPRTTTRYTGVDAVTRSTKPCLTYPSETITSPASSTTTITKLRPTCGPIVLGPATGPDHFLTLTKLCPDCPGGTVVTSAPCHTTVQTGRAPLVFGYHQYVYTNSTLNGFAAPSIFASGSAFNTGVFRTGAFSTGLVRHGSFTTEVPSTGTSPLVVLSTTKCNGKVTVETYSAGENVVSSTVSNGEVTVETQSAILSLVGHTAPNGQVTVETQSSTPSNGETNGNSPSQAAAIAASQATASQSTAEASQASAGPEAATQAAATGNNSAESNNFSSNSTSSNATGSTNQAATNSQAANSALGSNASGSANHVAANTAAAAQASQAGAAAQASASQPAAEAGETNSPIATNGTSPTSTSVKAFEGAASSFKASTTMVSFAVTVFSFMMILL
ncbi:hypothetical protein IMSHALPRED_001481 [Imshaugia aleurites]|uniref:Uncharacterized protein n=1 Tax=Imshaugia aleurites TaxID=172621 RepID=A0A8H3I3S3_9LECA|nr:hypothetical protein IMSHALPRED_001481 [Imshaugia aleurites]